MSDLRLEVANVAILCMCNEKYALRILLMDESQKFSHLIGNQGRETQ